VQQHAKRQSPEGDGVDPPAVAAWEKPTTRQNSPTEANSVPRRSSFGRTRSRERAAEGA